VGGGRPAAPRGGGRGADVVRVHDVEATVRALRVGDAITRGTV
jgi:dihydropteroate synthase